MNEDHAVRGECPECGSEIRPAYVLIEYARDDGTTAMFAECPECGDVVKSGVEE